MRIELVEHTCTTRVSLISKSLRLFDIVKFVSHDRKHTYRARAVKVHFLKHRSQLREASFRFHCSEEAHQRLICISLQKFRELLNILPSKLRKFSRILEHLTNQPAHGRRSRFVLLHILIQHGSIAHNLLLRQFRLFTHTSKARSKVYKIATCSRRILCKFIDNRTSRQHRSTQALSLIFAKHLCELTNILHSIVAQIIP